MSNHNYRQLSGDNVAERVALAEQQATADGSAVFLAGDRWLPMTDEHIIVDPQTNQAWIISLVMARIQDKPINATTAAEPAAKLPMHRRILQADYSESTGGELAQMEFIYILESDLMFQSVHKRLRDRRPSTTERGLAEIHIGDRLRFSTADGTLFNTAPVRRVINQPVNTTAEPR